MREEVQEEGKKDSTDSNSHHRNINSCVASDYDLKHDVHTKHFSLVVVVRGPTENTILITHR